jgi:hypothetical protein
MVAGLKLKEMGYRKGAEVIVTDPSGDPTNSEWRYVVTNNEHATLVSRNPEPPQWIQPGVRVRVEVRDHKATEAQVGGTRGSVALVVVSARELAEWRRSLIRMLNAIEGEGQPQAPANEGLAARIDRLRRGGRIPPDVAAFMRTVTEMRNQTEYNEKVLTPTESEAVSAAWRAVTEWRAKRR